MSLVARTRRLAYRAVDAVANRFPTTLGDTFDRAVHGYRAADRQPPPPVPDTPVRLFVGPTNYAGQGTAFARVIAAADPRVGAVTMAPVSPGGFAYPVDQGVPVAVYAGSRLWQAAQRAYLCEFTHVLMESGRPLFSRFDPAITGPEADYLLDAGVRVALLFHGSDIRLPSRHLAATPWSPFTDPNAPPTPGYEQAAAAHRMIADQLHARGVEVFVTTPDLLLDVSYARWCPVVVDPARWATDAPVLERTVPVVLHAPSKARIKGTDLVEPQLRALAEQGLIDYRRVEGVPWEQMPALIQGADVVIDQFRIGNYGVAACEAMAAGRLVLSHVTDQVRGHVQNACGLDLPILETPANELSDRLCAVLADRAAARALALRGPAFVRALHDGRRSAEVLASFVGEAS